MLSAVFIILFDIDRLGDSYEDVYLLITGIGLIVLAFVLRRWLSGGKSDKTNWLF